jgi:hypothetical protein
MAFHLRLSEVAKARDVGRRALRTISILEETEKLNVWVAMLNLENTYGSDESVEETFKEACQYNDAQEIHERLISIYIQSGKHEVCATSVNSAEYLNYETDALHRKPMNCSKSSRRSFLNSLLFGTTMHTSCTRQCLLREPPVLFYRQQHKRCRQMRMPT